MMRTTICVATFIVLLLTGFLATPGLFKIVNPEYLLALREYGRPLAKLSADSSDADSKISELRARISKLERSIKDVSNAAMAKQANLKIANASVDEIASVGIEAGTQVNALAIEKDPLETELVAWKETKASIASNQSELRKKIEAAAADSANIYIVARALALGAIGALMSIFAKYLTGPPRPLFEDSASMGRMWASIAMGGIVSVVVIGLFFTGFISIFANSPHNTGENRFLEGDHPLPHRWSFLRSPLPGSGREGGVIFANG